MTVTFLLWLVIGAMLIVAEITVGTFYLSSRKSTSPLAIASQRCAAPRRAPGQHQSPQGEVEAIRLVADATAAAISVVAGAITKDGGVEAINLKVAERYVEAFEELAKASNTLIVPSHMGDMATLDRAR